MKPQDLYSNSLESRFSRSTERIEAKLTSPSKGFSKHRAAKAFVFCLLGSKKRGADFCTFDFESESEK